MITKIWTENVHLLTKEKKYLGVYMVLNDDPKVVSILMPTTDGRTEVCEFSRKTGKCLRPKQFANQYSIQNERPLVKEDYNKE